MAIKIIHFPNRLSQNGMKLYPAIQKGVNFRFKCSLFVEVSLSIIGSWLSKTQELLTLKTNRKQKPLLRQHLRSGSPGGGAVGCQLQQPEFDFQSPHYGRSELTPTGCLLIFFCPDINLKNVK